MAIYITDKKSKTVKHFFTSRKVEKAIEMLLLLDDDLAWTESSKGYDIRSYHYIGDDSKEEDK